GLLLGGEDEVRDVDAGEGNGDEVLPLAADQLALGHEAPELFPDAPPHDLAEARVVGVDSHRRGPGTRTRVELAAAPRVLRPWRPRGRRCSRRSAGRPS